VPTRLVVVVVVVVVISSFTFTVTLRSPTERFLPITPLVSSFTLASETLTLTLVFGGASERSENARRSAVNKTYHKLANAAFTVPTAKTY